MPEHKHASVLRAIADGVPLSEFEVRGAGTNTLWMTLEFADFTARPDFWEVRRKHQHIIVNGFKVPKPLDVMPDDGCVYVSDIGREHFYEAIGTGSIWAARAVQRGIVHSTKKAAIAHAKAMLGIDPKWEE